MHRLALPPAPSQHAWLQRLAVVVLSAVIGVFVSERVYWYWSRSLIEQVEVVAFYAPAFAIVLWLMQHYRIRDTWGLLLAVPIYAYLVEGAIVPVLYSGGPFVPVFPAMFTFWHGVVGVVLVWYFFRSWLLAERWKPLLAACIGLGSYWGTFAMGAVAELDAEDSVAGPDASVLGPLDFAGYAAIFSVVLAVAHWLLGQVWITTFTPSQRAERVWMVVVGFAIIGWTFVIPWAAPMLIAYVALQLWGLRRYAHVERSGPTLLERLDGPVRVRALIPLAALPATAAGVYAIWWKLDPSDAFVEEWIFLGTSMVQVLLGGTVLAVSLRRSGREVVVDDASSTQPVRSARPGSLPR